MDVASMVKKKFKGLPMPSELYIAEFILTYVLTRNMSVSYYLGISGITDLEKMVNCALIIYVTLTTLITINTMIGIPSSNRYSWRSSVRCLIILIPMTLLYDVFELSYYFIPVWVLLTIMTLALVIMFTPRVRRYHTPALREVPSLKEWVKFIFIRPEETAYEYRFVYSKEEEK